MPPLSLHDAIPVCQFHYRSMFRTTPSSATVIGPTPRERRHATKRAQILDAASRIFATQAYHLVNMDGVAQAAGVGKGTLYRYFTSKEDLYLEIGRANV